MQVVKIMSGRADCKADLDKLVMAIRRDQTMLLNSVIEKKQTDPKLMNMPDVEFQLEFATPTDIEKVIDHARVIDDAAALVETLRPVPMFENSMVREYQTDFRRPGGF